MLVEVLVLLSTLRKSTATDILGIEELFAKNGLFERYVREKAESMAETSQPHFKLPACFGDAVST